jgi:hypothetical protein
MSANPKTTTTLGSDLFIGGQWKQGAAGSLENIDPGNRETIDACTGYVRRVTHDEIADAVG